jgi:hypothetical protein
MTADTTRGAADDDASTLIERVDSLTMTLIPMTDDSKVMGPSAAMTASSSAVMFILVSERAR